MKRGISGRKLTETLLGTSEVSERAVAGIAECDAATAELDRIEQVLRIEGVEAALELIAAPALSDLVRRFSLTGQE